MWFCVCPSSLVYLMRHHQFIHMKEDVFVLLYTDIHRTIFALLPLVSFNTISGYNLRSVLSEGIFSGNVI